MSFPQPPSWQQRPSQQPERPRTSSIPSIPNSQGGGGGGGTYAASSASSSARSIGATGGGGVAEDVTISSRSDPLDFLTGKSLPPSLRT